MRFAKAFPETSRHEAVLFVAAVVLGPVLLFYHLHRLWNPDGAYAYGWVVPMLAAFLCKSRWDDRPAPSSPMGDAAILAILFTLLAIPARWLQEAAPERAICAWWYGLSVLGVSLSLVSLAGGFSWLRWFSFPFAFILTAIPWPHFLELIVSNFLMRGTAGVTVEILCLIGFPAAQSGNLVHIETGVIDIDEACSGIRSLQAMVMIALFLGEMFRLTLARRLSLLGLALAVTLLANVTRTVILASIGFNHGMAAVDRYHDIAGFIVLTVSLSAAALLAYLLRTRDFEEPDEDAFMVERILPYRLGASLLAVFLLAEVGVEAWYRLREPKWEGWSWNVNWPSDREAFKSFDLPSRSLHLLMCDESKGAAWKEPNGGEWSLYWIRWNPGNPAAESAKVHRPDVCLNAEGAVMDRDLGMRVSTLGKLKLPFRSYIFHLGEKTLYVFFCLHEEFPGAPADSGTQFEGRDMFQRAREGRRRIGQQTLEFALSGYRTEGAAEQAFKARIGQLLQTSQTPESKP